MASPRSSVGCYRTPGFPAGPLGGRAVPVVGLGTASLRFVGEESFRGALLTALEVGYRHIDTASVYGSERVVGEALAGAARRGVIASSEEVFVTTKVWCTQCHPDLVLPSLRESLQWIYEQGASMVTTSTKRERLKENIDIFDWQLSDEDRLKISQIPQHKKVSVLSILCPDGVSSVDLSEVDVVEV